MTLMSLPNILVIFQLELWREFGKQHRMEHRHVTHFIQIIIAIAVNTVWIAYSKLNDLQQEEKQTVGGQH